MWLASIAMETGPTVATASCSFDSSPCGTSTKPVSVAPMSLGLYSQVSSCRATQSHKTLGHPICCTYLRRAYSQASLALAYSDVVSIFGYAVGFCTFLKIKTAVHSRFRFLWLFTNKIPHTGCQMRMKNNVHSNSITRKTTERGMLTDDAISAAHCLECTSPK